MCLACVIRKIFRQRGEGPSPWEQVRDARDRQPRPMGRAGKVLWYVTRPIKWTLLAPILTYKYAISPLLPPMCRYYPTCSVFMMQAIEQKGILWGPILGTFRVLSCNPIGGYGYDPVENYPPYYTGRRWVWRKTTWLEEAHPEYRLMAWSRVNPDGAPETDAAADAADDVPAAPTATKPPTTAGPTEARS